MEMLLSLILGPLGKILGIIVAIGGAILYGKYYQAKAEKAQAKADGYQAQVEIAQGREEVQHEVEKVVEETRQKVEAGDAAGLSDSFNRLRDR
jgi:predicted negative regulator of RcsB-dependent stress response